MLTGPLAPLTTYNQFIIWRLDGNVKKPINPNTLKPHNPHDPAIWMDAATAEMVARELGYNVGFTLTDNDPFFLLDIDHCLIDGQWSPLTMELLGRFSGAAVEISTSGDGLHVIGTGACPNHGCKNQPLGLELYTEARFIALTGTNAIGDASTDHSAALASAVSQYFPPPPRVDPQNWTTEPVAQWYGPSDDDDLIKKALKSGSVAAKFGAATSFADLWNRNVNVLAEHYPDPSETREFDYSQADAALAQHLAFWTGNNCERIRRIMERSGLVRDKWSRRGDDYLARTILRAVGLQTTVHGEGMRDAPKPPREGYTGAPDAIMVSGYQYLASPQQVDYFKGCVYVRDAHKIFVPDGDMLKPEQFNAEYGGYVFQLNDDASKTTKKAWEVFTESQVVRFPKAVSTCFRPGEAPGSIIDGRVNTFVPCGVRRIAGDVGPFLAHVAKLVPDEGDRAILLAYMAACVQHQGKKFYWAPLIQGVEGNGKTLLTWCVMQAIGEKYSHMPPAHEISEKYNSWLFNSIFIGVEDIYVPEQKRELIEVLKPMITNERLANRAMQTEQVMRDVCANFMFNSNHKDAVRKTRNDRRFCVFYSAQQEDADLARDGMTGAYFPDLYRWLRADGYAIVTDYLLSYQIPDELNPGILCHRAPITTSTEEAIRSSYGLIEQEVLEAIDEGRIGFAGGWVSSYALDKLLDNLNKTGRIAPNKRRELMQNLGYDWHPALRDGRVNNTIPLDGGKPKLYIKKGHISANLSTAAEVAKAYEDAQVKGGVAPSPFVRVGR